MYGYLETNVLFRAHTAIQNATDELSTIAKICCTSVWSKNLIELVQQPLDSVILDGLFVWCNLCAICEVPWMRRIGSLLGLNDDVDVNFDEASVQLSDIRIVGRLRSWICFLIALMWRPRSVVAFRWHSDCSRVRKLASLRDRFMMLSRWAL